MFIIIFKQHHTTYSFLRQVLIPCSSLFLNCSNTVNSCVTENGLYLHYGCPQTCCVTAVKWETLHLEGHYYLPAALKCLRASQEKAQIQSVFGPAVKINLPHPLFHFREFLLIWSWRPFPQMFSSPRPVPPWSNSPFYSLQLSVQPTVLDTCMKKFQKLLWGSFSLTPLKQHFKCIFVPSGQMGNLPGSVFPKTSSMICWLHSVPSQYMKSFMVFSTIL